MSSLAGGWDRRGGSGRLGLPRQQPPVAVDVGCNCRGARLLGSLVSALKSFHARGGRKAKPSPHAAWSWSSSGATATTTTAFTPSVSATTATSASSAAGILHSWGPATYAVNASALYDGGDGVHDADLARRQRRRRRRRSRRAGQGRRAATPGEEEEEGRAPYENFHEAMMTDKGMRGRT